MLLSALFKKNPAKMATLHGTRVISDESQIIISEKYTPSLQVP